jgi:hypothetical protein
MATAISVFARLFIWGEVSVQRNRPRIERLMQKVCAAASGVQAVLLAVDGLAACPKAALKAFHTQLHTGKPGRPHRLPWLDLHTVGVTRWRGWGKTRPHYQHLRGQDSPELAARSDSRVHTVLGFAYIYEALSLRTTMCKWSALSRYCSNSQVSAATCTTFAYASGSSAASRSRSGPIPPTKLSAPA